MLGNCDIRSRWVQGLRCQDVLGKGVDQGQVVHLVHFDVDVDVDADVMNGSSVASTSVVLDCRCGARCSNAIPMLGMAWSVSDAVGCC